MVKELLLELNQKKMELLFQINQYLLQMIKINKLNQSNQLIVYLSKKMKKIQVNQVAHPMRKIQMIHLIRKNQLILHNQNLLLKKYQKIKNHLQNMVMDIGLNFY